MNTERHELKLNARRIAALIKKLGDQEMAIDNLLIGRFSASPAPKKAVINIWSPECNCWGSTSFSEFIDDLLDATPAEVCDNLDVWIPALKKAVNKLERNMPARYVLECENIQTKPNDHR